MTSFTHSLAIVIGIDAYGNGIPRLTTVVNDAARLAELLADAHGYETFLLTEPATSQPVTRERLRTLFTQELPTRLGDDDRLLVYFAGHGVALDGDDGPRGYLVPQEARPGAEAVAGWSLPLAARDLLFGLPDLPPLDLPDKPYRNLDWYHREDAPVFFGRGQEIRELYDRVTAPGSPPLVLFYGQSGVGKSSLLAAGLLPRLDSSHVVRYARRDQAVGLLGTLAAALGAAPDADLSAAWRAVEAQAGLPLLVVLDQMVLFPSWTSCLSGCSPIWSSRLRDSSPSPSCFQGQPWRSGAAGKRLSEISLHSTTCQLRG